MATATFVDIETDISEPLKLLEELGGKKSTMMRRLLTGIGTKAKNKAKREYSHVLKRQTGYLYSTIDRKVTRNGLAVVITAHKRSDKMRYGFVLSHGAYILPVNKPYLTITSGNILRRVKHVEIPPKDFIEGPVNTWLASGEYKHYLNTATQKQIDKLEKKISK